MFSWVGRLIGTKKAISDITDKDSGLLVKAGSWIGTLNYTDQEKAQDNQLIREWGLKQLSALEPFKVVQRVIAFAVMGAWLLVLVNIILAIWVEAIAATHGVRLDVRDYFVELMMSDYVFWPVVSVLSLYMSGGVLPQLFGKNKGKDQQ